MTSDPRLLNYLNVNVIFPISKSLMVAKLGKTNTVHIALRLGSRVEALTTAQQQ